ncbi:MAG TPA: AP2/ERF family transcription factor [Nitrospira sp.]|nr:AP2/ERF family transcription factor [Nitrospira sp.]
MLNIRRVDHDASSTHCWRVKVQRRKQLFTRDFSDGLHGGREAALQAAQAYRDMLVRTQAPLSKPDYCAILKKNNRSGVSGLTRVDRWELLRGRRVRKVFWGVQWPIGNGRSRHKTFSIMKYGEEAAFQLALAARETALQALISQTFSPFACRDGKS